MPIVGTAGHVDHGKSTLVQALTGIDPDRLAEEKQRGLTIDLGFAWAVIGGHDVGFIDVPGHGRFIKNMLAGVGAIDCALLVVAADSGWMPQTEEHMTILDLLGVDRGVIALSRIDLVDDETRELAVLEILDEIAGTSLSRWPIIPVSAPRRTGLAELEAALVDALDVPRSLDERPFRMWIDRAFTIAGSGHVVTGTILSGSVATGDDLELLPGGTTVRVRGVQHHGEAVEVAGAGSRTAINVTGVETSLERGQIVASVGAAMTTRRMVLELRAARAVGQIPERGAFHLHVGTARRSIRLRRSRHGDVFVGMVDEPVVAAAGTHVILRDAGRRTVVGGGVILDPLPPAHLNPHYVEALTTGARRIDDGALVGSGAAAAWADALVSAHGAIPMDRVVAATGGGLPANGRSADGFVVSEAEVRRVAELARQLTERHHVDHPLRPGIPKSELASRIGVAPGVLGLAVEAAGMLEEVGSVIRISSFVDALPAAEEEAWLGVRSTLEKSFDVPRLGDLAVDQEIVHFLIRRGDLVRIADDLALTAWQAQQIDERVSELGDGFTVSQFKDHFGMARRQAVPVLEWLDHNGRTRRDGDVRTVRSEQGRSADP